MNTFKHIALALTVLLLASCQKEGGIGIGQGEECTVEYNVSLDQITRASGEKVSVTHIWYAAYKVDGNSLTLKAEHDLAKIVDGNASCPVRLVPGNSYKVVFVAQHYDETGNGLEPKYSINAQNMKLEMPQNPVANSDDYDLFWQVDDIVDFKGGEKEPVELRRKVAKISFLASEEDWNAAVNAGNLPTYSGMTIHNVPRYLNLTDGTTSEPAQVVNYSKSPLAPSGNILGSAYCLAGSPNADIDLHLYKGDEGTELIKTLNAKYIPIKENYKININSKIL